MSSIQVSMQKVFKLNCWFPNTVSFYPVFTYRALFQLVVFEVTTKIILDHSHSHPLSFWICQDSMLWTLEYPITHYLCMTHTCTHVIFAFAGFNGVMFVTADILLSENVEKKNISDILLVFFKFLGASCLSSFNFILIYISFPPFH